MENVTRPDHLWIGDYNATLSDGGITITHLSGDTTYHVPAIKSIAEFTNKHIHLCQALAGIAPMDIMQPFRGERMARRPQRRRHAGNAS